MHEDPEQRLLAIAVGIADRDLARWFGTAVRNYLAGSVRTLDEGLGLGRRGAYASRASRARIDRRNTLLAIAASQIPGTDWQRAVEIARRVGRLDRVRNPGDFDRLLLRAAEHADLPRTPEGILKAIS